MCGSGARIYIAGKPISIIAGIILYIRVQAPTAFSGAVAGATSPGAYGAPIASAARLFSGTTIWASASPLSKT